MKVTGFERELGTGYTAATLAFLKRRHPDVRFVWIMGADNLASFDRWQHWRRIAEIMPIAVVDRPGWRLQVFRLPRRSPFRAGVCRNRRPVRWRTENLLPGCC